MKIALDEFVRYLRSISGQSVLTQFQHKPFTVETASTGLYITPLSSGKARYHDLETVSRIVEIFNKTGSLRPKDYQVITWNSSYTLALIKAYLETGNNRVAKPRSRRSLSTTLWGGYARTGANEGLYENFSHSIILILLIFTNACQYNQDSSPEHILNKSGITKDTYTNLSLCQQLIS